MSIPVWMRKETAQRAVANTASYLKRDKRRRFISTTFILSWPGESPNLKTLLWPAYPVPCEKVHGVAPAIRSVKPPSVFFTRGNRLGTIIFVGS